MSELTWEQEQTIMDYFGKMVIKNVRDPVLSIAMTIARYKNLNNPVKKEQYKELDGLTPEQAEKVCDLLSYSISNAIAGLLDLCNSHSHELKLLLTYEGTEYNLQKLSEDFGSEIVIEEDGWIPKFSEIGRFYL